YNRCRPRSIFIRKPIGRIKQIVDLRRRIRFCTAWNLSLTFLPRRQNLGDDRKCPAEPLFAGRLRSLGSDRKHERLRMQARQGAASNNEDQGQKENRSRLFHKRRSVLNFPLTSKFPA